MSKSCSRCGAGMDYGDKVCWQCGKEIPKGSVMSMIGWSCIVGALFLPPLGILGVILVAYDAYSRSRYLIMRFLLTLLLSINILLSSSTIIWKKEVIISDQEYHKAVESYLKKHKPQWIDKYKQKNNLTIKKNTTQKPKFVSEYLKGKARPTVNIAWKDGKKQCQDIGMRLATFSELSKLLKIFPKNNKEQKKLFDHYFMTEDKKVFHSSFLTYSAVTDNANEYYKKSFIRIGCIK